MPKHYAINITDSIELKEEIGILKKGGWKIEKSKHGDKPENINYTSRFIEYGNLDYEASLVLFNIQDREYDLMNQAAFLCAQATEKYLKAFLFWKFYNTMPSEKILKKLKKFNHNLETLLHECVKENSGFQKFKTQVIKLNNYSLLKYPDVEDKMVYSNTGFHVSSELSKDVNRIGKFVKKLVN
jgi:HEPN domain-containing protein